MAHLSRQRFLLVIGLKSDKINNSEEEGDVIK